MPYVKLSEQIEKLANPQRSDTFVKALRNAVREGDIDAADMQGRFTLPKKFSKRGSDDTYTRDVKDMVIDATPEFQEWFDNINKELTPARAGGRAKPTIENIEAGVVDFKALAQATRDRMAASFAKGQHLGNSRASGRAKPGPKPKKK